MANLSTPTAVGQKQPSSLTPGNTDVRYVRVLCEQRVNSTVTINCISQESGFIFTGDQHVELRLLSFIGCGAVEEYYFLTNNGTRNESVVFSSAVHIAPEVSPLCPHPDT